jgi:site-specific DNA-methyltransferase (adenine-specific)
MYSFVGDVVLDPFNGSGSTCVAAKMTGRTYIGVDLSEEYCAIAQERINLADEFAIAEIES